MGQQQGGKMVAQDEIQKEAAKSAIQKEVSQIEKIRPVTQVFNDLDAAERAYQYLMDKGYNRDEVSVVMSDEARHRLGKNSAIVTSHTESDVADPDSKVEGGVGVSTAAGALSGMVAAAGISMVAPGFGLIVLGPLAGLGAGLGAILGGLFGIPFGELAERESGEKQGEGNTDRKDPADYENSIRQGKVILSVEPRTAEDRERISQEWDRIGANAA
jgi:hypothetical protein